jgi:hypothetical protein
MAKKRSVGRPTKPKREKYKTPQRQLGRVDDDTWEVLRSVTEQTGVPFIQWALPVLVKEAKRLLKAK